MLGDTPLVEMMCFFTLLRNNRKQCPIPETIRNFQQWSGIVVRSVTCWRSSMSLTYLRYLCFIYFCFIQSVFLRNTTNVHLERALVRIGFFIPVSAPSTGYASHFRSTQFATFCPFPSKCMLWCSVKLSLIDPHYQEACRSIPCPSFGRRGERDIFRAG